MSDDPTTPAGDDAGQGAGHTNPTANPPAEPPTIAALRERAKALEVPGRSSMGREELEAAIAEAEAHQAPKTAFAGVMGGLFHNHDTDRPSTPEETGRPPLVEVAEASAAARARRSRRSRNRKD